MTGERQFTVEPEVNIARSYAAYLRSPLREIGICKTLRRKSVLYRRNDLKHIGPYHADLNELIILEGLCNILYNTENAMYIPISCF